MGRGRVKEKRNRKMYILRDMLCGSQKRANWAAPLPSSSLQGRPSFSVQPGLIVSLKENVTLLPNGHFPSDQGGISQSAHLPKSCTQQQQAKFSMTAVILEDTTRVKFLIAHPQTCHHIPVTL
jgi:hypothetical protein